MKHYRNKNSGKLSALDFIGIAINEVKKKVPIEIEDGIILYDIVFDKNEKLMSYYYMLTNLLKEDLTDEAILKLEEKWKSVQLEIVKNHPQNTSFVKGNVTFECFIEDSRNEEILSFIIPAEEYR